MNHRNLSRTGGGRPNRQLGEAPAIGKVSRSTGSVLGSENNASAQASRRDKSTRITIAWTGFFSFIAICIIAAVIFFFYKWDSGSSGSGSYGLPDTLDIDAAFLDFEDLELPSLDEESAKSLVTEYLQSTDQSSVKERFIVHSAEEAVVPALAEVRATEGPITQLKWVGQIYSNNRAYDQIIVIRQKDGKKSNRIAPLFQGDDDLWRIDFDAYMRTSTPSWEEILSGNSKNSIVRVFINDYNYYNGIYSDDQIWEAFSIVSPDIPDIMYGYVKRDSAQALALRKIISSNSHVPRVTLGLRSEGDADERQFEIARVFAEEWSLSPEPFDESF